MFGSRSGSVLIAGSRIARGQEGNKFSQAAEL